MMFGLSTNYRPPDRRRYGQTGQAIPSHSRLDYLNLRPFLGNESAFNAAVLELMNELVWTPKLAVTSIRLYVVLARRANRKTGCCYPGIETLARELGTSAQAVRKACRQLERSGFILIEQNASKYRTNVFYLDFRKLSASDAQRIATTNVPTSETRVSGSLTKEKFGETESAGLSAEDRELLQYAAMRRWSHG